jgi:hypothetical protein
VIRAELSRQGDPETVVAVATWDGTSPHVELTGDEVAGIDSLFRATPVVVEDASLRRLGSHGVVVLQPGSLEWFRAALQVRAPELGLAVRFVTDRIENGWDPAANYRTFEQQARRLAST